MPRHSRLLVVAGLLAGTLAAGCGGARQSESLQRAETFSWIRQPITFSPPSARWYRQADGGSGLTSVRFILEDGGGQCITVSAFRKLAERDRSEDIARLRARRDSLSQHEFLQELSSARPRTDNPISEREAETARAVNRELDRATTDYLNGSMTFVSSDLDAAVRYAAEYRLTLPELLSHVRLRPERMENPEWWRTGYERDTVVAGLPAYAIDDSLVLPEQQLLYHEVLWVVNGCGFKATFQGREENLPMFRRVVDSIQFPEPAVASR